LIGLWNFGDRIDLNRIYTNDIAAILTTYGVEAAQNAIKKEITHVFAAYGISVDPRHLSLIADYMTFEGYYKPLNRIGMEASTSPFLKMSFETTMHFLTEAAKAGHHDHLTSPSSCLVLGELVPGGTGCHDLILPLTHF
jgi:DNA-directed RNA polymerase I subunit RPA1